MGEIDAPCRRIDRGRESSVTSCSSDRESEGSVMSFCSENWRRVSSAMSCRRRESSVSDTRVVGESTKGEFGDELQLFLFFFQGDQNTKQKKIVQNHHIVELDA